MVKTYPPSVGIILFSYIKAIPCPLNFLLFSLQDSMLSLINKHTVNGIKLTPSFGQGDFTTLGKTNIKGRIRKGKLSINDKVQILEGDIVCTNGIIHVIDEVLLL